MILHVGHKSRNNVLFNKYIIVSLKLIINVFGMTHPYPNGPKYVQ
jgi:hypothetical protein